MKNNRMKKGFTLAEILITLTIIGVVASLTIPSLMNNIGDQANKTAWKQAYADLSQVTMRMSADNGGSFTGIFADSNALRNEYLKYLNYVKSCNNAGNDGCWHNANDWKALDGTPRFNYAQPGLILSNGNLLLLGINDTNCNYSLHGMSPMPLECGNMIIDINGFKGPNIVGKDIFGVELLKNLIIPFGGQNSQLSSYCEGSTGLYSGEGCSAKYLYQ